jgi:N-terminal half of MaoC dehydratase
VTIERFPVEATHILMFARAIGDPNPAYSDPDSAEAKAAGGIVAPPTFANAGAQFDPDYPLRPKYGQPWFGSGKTPSGVTREGSGGVGGGLHAEQVFEYHQPIRPGMVLKTTSRPGATWERESRRGGKLLFSESITEYVDAGTGEPVVTARTVGVRTERPVEREGPA